MARRRKSDLLADYRRRIEISRNWRRQEQYDELWRRLADLYAGKHFLGDLSTEDRIAVNISFATINVIYPTVSVNRPKTTVLARDADDQDRALIAEAVVNAWWDAYDVLPEFRLAVKDALIVGHGWIKTGWRFSEQERPRPPEAIQADFDAARAQADQAAAAAPELAGEMPTDDEIMSSVPTTEMVVDEDQPWAERISYHDMFVDPEGTTMRNIGWLAQRIVRPLAEVERDERYDAAARKKVQADRGINTEYLTKNRRDDYGDDVKRVTVWEFYDLKARTMCVFAQSGEGFLVAPMPIPYRSGHPYEMIRNYDVPDQFYPMGDLEAIEPLQEELNKSRSQLMNMRKHFARKYLYREESFDSAGRQALESPVDGTMVPVKGNTVNLAEVVREMPTPTIAVEAFNYTQVTEDDINTVTGVSEYQRGGGPGIRRTATEAAIIQDSVNARSAEKLAIIERAIARVSKRLIDLARQYATREDVVRVVGRGGRTAYVPFQPDDFDADLDYIVEAGSTVPKGEDYRRQEAMNLLAAMAPFIGTVVDPMAMATWAFEQFGIKNPQRFMAGGGMPMPADPTIAGAPPGAPQLPQGGPGPENNPMAQDPDLAAAMGALNPQAAQSQAPGPGPVPGAIQQLASQVGLNLG